MAAVPTMSKEAEQQAIAEHLKTCGYWYARFQKISNRQLTFPTWEEEERAGNEAYDKWDEALTWLEAHGIADADIVYDEATEQARLK